MAIFPPPPVQGLGTVGGFKLYVEDRASLGFEELYAQLQNSLGKGRTSPELAGLFSSFQVNVPQVDAHVDRERVKTYGVPLGDVYETLQVYLGSLYVNDFNRFGRTYQVNVQAESAVPHAAGTDPPARDAQRPGRRWCRWGRWSRSSRTYGPDQVMHYNGYPAAEINGGAGTRITVPVRLRQRLTEAAREELPNGMTFEWTELTYQEILAGNTMVFIFPLCVLFAYLVLAAQYESWALPLIVILIVPMTLLCALTGVWLDRR